MLLETFNKLIWYILLNFFILKYLEFSFGKLIHNYIE